MIMALTAAEKQGRYRERHLGIDGAKLRIQLFVSVHSKAQLRGLARHYGYTVTKMIEQLAADAERALLDNCRGAGTPPISTATSRTPPVAPTPPATRPPSRSRRKVTR
jgi:hypothetical protein